MGVGTGGTFASDAKKIGMGLGDIQTMQQSLNPKGLQGWVPYKFKGKSYQVQYKNERGDLTLLAIKSV